MTNMDHGTRLLLTVFWSVIALATLLSWRKAVKRSRAVSDVPLSKCRSAAQGYVKLEGIQKTVPNHPLSGPLTGKPCTWWRYKIEEKVRSQDGERYEWSPMRQASSPSFILLDDGTGQVMINPIGAEIAQWTNDVWCSDAFWPERPTMTHDQDGRYRYTESRMHDGEQLFVTGKLTTYAAQSGLTRAAPDAAHVLDQWKRDQATLLQRFDADGNGAIDVDEWDKARDAATSEANAGALASPAVVTPEINVIVRPADGRPFVVSPGSIETGAVPGTSSGKIPFALFIFSCAALLWVLSRHR